MSRPVELARDDPKLTTDLLRASGARREMQVCHTQPHLVPPMKLVVYDDLPSPTVHHPRHSLSSWVVEGRQLASKASARASMTLRRHSTASAMKIGAPTDFRRVQSFHPHVASTDSDYRPLELRIHQSGNQLPALPSFDSFQLDELHQRSTLAIPPPTLASSSVRDRRCQSTTSAVIRKPVGSGNRRSWGSQWGPVIQAPPPVRIASGLIPHFSIVNPVETVLPETPVRISTPMPLEDGDSKRSLDIEWPRHESHLPASTEEEEARPQTPRVSPRNADDLPDEPFLNEATHPRDSPSTASSRTMPSQISSLRRPTPPLAEKRKTIASVSSLSNRMTQWFFPSKAAASPTAVSLAGENGFAWERTRTLSGTTMASTVTTITGGATAWRPNTSMSGTFTNTSTPRTSLRGPSPTAEKELDVGFSYPTIHEERQQQQPSDPTTTTAGGI